MVSRNILFGLYAACVLLYESSAFPLPKLAPGTNAVLLPVVGQRFFQRLHSPAPPPNHKRPCCTSLRAFPPIVTNDSFLTLNIT